MNNTQKTALIAGSTGLVGSYLLNLLLESDNYEKVISLVRKPSNMRHEKLLEQVIDFNELEKEIAQLQAQDVFICLGTTIKKAKTQENFKLVDLEYPVKIAEIMHKNGSTQIAVVSAMGANANSSIFYNKVKGQMESQIEAISYNGTFILRPSLLMGARNEFRFGEMIGQKVMCIIDPLMVGPARKYRSINAFDVAQAMILLCNAGLSGQHKLESDKIVQLVKNYRAN